MIVDRSQSNYTDHVDYREAAVTLWRQAGAYCHDRYDEYRTRPYPELPERLPIVIGITAYGRCLGLTRGGWEHGPRISIASRLFRTVGLRAVDDTVVHELLHAWLLITGQEPDHDSEAWYAAVRRLSPAVLGHELQARRGGAEVPTGAQSGLDAGKWSAEDPSPQGHQPRGGLSRQHRKMAGPTAWLRLRRPHAVSVLLAVHPIHAP